MAILRPEVTGRRAGAADIGRNGGPPLNQADWIELQRIVDLKEASWLCGLSVDTIKRRHGDKIIVLSERRRGMRVRDALLLNETAE